MATPPRSRLGRGLGALLSLTESASIDIVSTTAIAAPPADTDRQTPVRPDEVLPGDRLATLPVDDISVNPHQPRKEFDQAALDTLADSIKANGVIQPIIVRPDPAGGYQLVAGERRLRAARQAKLVEIPVVVRDIDPYTQAQWALVENIHREDLNPMDRAEAYATLLQQLGLTQAELAGRLGEQRSSIANYLRLMELDGNLRMDVKAGELSFGHAKVLAGVSDTAEQRRLATLVKAEHLSVRNLERLVEHGPPAAPAAQADIRPAATKSTSLHLKEIEQQMVHQLGLRVQLRGGTKAGTGKVVIHYRSLEEFDELMKRCQVELTNE